jgi:type III pantothenate kinase
MNLVIDIGNSRVKAAVFRENELLQHYHFHRPGLTEIKRILSEHPGLRFAIVSSVVSHAKDIVNIVGHKLNCIELNFNTALPITNCYATPETLGNDRLAGVIGASKRFPGKNILVIDAGTCLKFDFITSNKEYLGGAISPGLQMRFKALSSFTDRLPPIQLNEEFDSLIGKSTEESIRSGVQNGILAEVSSIINQYAEQYDSLQCVLTGGDWHFFENGLKNSIFAAPSLLLEGLNEILRFHTEKNQA